MYVGMSVVSTYILVVVALNPLKNSSLPLLPWLDGWTPPLVNQFFNVCWVFPLVQNMNLCSVCYEILPATTDCPSLTANCRLARVPLTMNKNSNLCHRVGRARECFLVTNLRLLSVLRSLSHSIVIVKGRKVHLTIITCMTEPPMCSLELTCKMKENISTLMTSNKYNM